MEIVVLLHGLFRTSKSMRTVERSFKDAGYAVANVDYPSTRHPIEKLSEMVYKEIEPLTKEYDRLHFVTHSMGGIITRCLFKTYPGKIPVGRVVMMAPPNKGSEIVDWLGWLWLFKLLNGEAGRQLHSKRGLPTRLGPADFEVGIIMGDKKNINFIFSPLLPGPNDGKVTVESAKLEGMKDFLLMPASHAFIMHNNTAIEQAKFFLEHGEFDR